MRYHFYSNMVYFLASGAARDAAEDAATTDPGPHRTTSRPIWVRGEAPEAGEAAAAADSSRFSEFFVSFFSLITCFCTRLSFTFRVNQQLQNDTCRVAD